MEGTATDQVAVITGASGSVGAATVRALAAEGWRVIMACRNVAKGETVRQHILCELPQAQLEVRELEMSSTDSIRHFAEGLAEVWLDALFCNAGVISRNYSLTPEGVEHTMSVNYLGPARLIDMLLPRMRKGARLVCMVSLTVRFARLDKDWRQWPESRFGQLSTYSASKLALLYHTIALARRHPELRINVADPGIVNSNMITMGRWFDPLADLLFRPFIKTPEQGAAPALRALHATESMLYYVGKKQAPIPQRYLRSSLVEELYACL